MLGVLRDVLGTIAKFVDRDKVDGGLSSMKHQAGILACLGRGKGG